jgi:hypothetical protein
MAGVAEDVVRILNNVKLASEPSAKVGHPCRRSVHARGQAELHGCYSRTWIRHEVVTRTAEAAAGGHSPYGRRARRGARRRCRAPSPAPQCPNAAAAPQLSQLQKLRELLLAREPQLLDSFLEEICLLQVRVTPPSSQAPRAAALAPDAPPAPAVRLMQ